MKITMIIITAINVLSLLCYFVVHQKRKNNNKINVVFQYEDIGLVMILMSWFMCAMMLWTYTKSEATIYTTIPLAILGLFMILPYFNVSLRYDDVGFEYRNWIGIKYKVTYADVKGIRTGLPYRVFFKNHSITVAETDPKIKVFLDKLDYGHVAATGRGVIKSPTFKAKKDPLNGNSPIGWVLFICYLFVAIFGVFGCFRVMNRDFIMPWEHEEIETYFYFYNYYGNEYSDNYDAVLYGGDYEEIFVIKEYERHGEQLEPLSYICQGDIFNLTVDKEGDVYHILSMTGEDGQVYVSLEASAEIYDSYVQRDSVILCMGGALMAVYGIFGILVNRNPERYSKVVRALYRIRKQD